MRAKTIGEALSRGWRGVARCVRGREDAPRRRERAKQLKSIMAELSEVGMPRRMIVRELTRRGIATPRGKSWHAQTVTRVATVPITSPAAAF